jgi:hypothetical protein
MRQTDDGKYPDWPAVATGPFSDAPRKSSRSKVDPAIFAPNVIEFPATTAASKALTATLLQIQRYNRHQIYEKGWRNELGGLRASPRSRTKLFPLLVKRSTIRKPKFIPPIFSTAAFPTPLQEALCSVITSIKVL